MNNNPGDDKLLGSADFSQEALNKALLKHATGHWTARYSLPLLGGGIVAGIVFGFTLPVFIAILGVCGFGSISWVYNYFVQGKNFTKDHVRQLHDAIERQTALKRRDLQKELLSFEETRGAEQLDQIKKRFDTLVDILGTKFDSTQLTYHRYYGVAQQVYLATIDNLTAVVMAYKTVESIDLRYNNKRLKELAKISDIENNLIAKTEQGALLRSNNNYDDQMKKIAKLMADNELAMTSMEDTAIAISKITRDNANADLENAMKDLIDLTKRASNYNV